MGFEQIQDFVQIVESPFCILSTTRRNKEERLRGGGDARAEKEGLKRARKREGEVKEMKEIQGKKKSI